MWQLIQDDERAAFARHGPLVVAVLRAALDEAFFDDLDGLLADVADAAPGSVCILLVRAGASPGRMSGPVRERTKRLLTEHSTRLSGFAYVNSGSGLKAKLLRGTMNAALLAAGFSGKVFTDVDSAMRWLVGLPGQPPGFDETARDVRARVSELTG